jgi:hypothetical protein
LEGAIQKACKAKARAEVRKQIPKELSISDSMSKKEYREAVKHLAGILFRVAWPTLRDHCRANPVYNFPPR